MINRTRNTESEQEVLRFLSVVLAETGVMQQKRLFSLKPKHSEDRLETDLVEGVQAGCCKPRNASLDVRPCFVSLFLRLNKRQGRPELHCAI